MLIEYADFQCGYCGKFARDTEPELVKRYVDEGVLRIEFRNLPIFGEESERAARAAWAAGRQGRFWEFHAAAYGEGAKEKGFGVARLKDLAEEAGVPDLDRFARDLDSTAARQAVERDQQEGYGLGAASTPSFLINGRPCRGGAAAGGVHRGDRRGGEARGGRARGGPGDAGAVRPRAVRHGGAADGGGVGGGRRRARPGAPGDGHRLPGRVPRGLLALVSPCSALLLPAFFAYSTDGAARLVARTGVLYAGLATTPGAAGRGGLPGGPLRPTATATLLVTAGGWLIIALGAAQVLGLGFAPRRVRRGERPGSARRRRHRPTPSGWSTAWPGSAQGRSSAAS